MLFLVVLCVLPVASGKEDEARKSGVNEFAVAPLTSDDANKAGPLQIGNKLANLARHIVESVTGAARLPTFRPENAGREFNGCAILHYGSTSPFFGEAGDRKEFEGCSFPNRFPIVQASCHET